MVRDAGLKPPVFDNGYNFFKATLFRSPLIGSSEREWLKQFASYKLSNRQVAALAQLKSEDPESIDNGSYRAINDMHGVGDDRKARREITQLVKLKILSHKGELRYRRYFLKDNLSVITETSYE